MSPSVIAASAGALSRKRQYDRLLELGGANLLLGALLEDTSLLGHEFRFLSRLTLTSPQHAGVFLDQVGKHRSPGLLDVLLFEHFSSGS